MTFKLGTIQSMRVERSKAKLLTFASPNQAASLRAPSILTSRSFFLNGSNTLTSLDPVTSEYWRLRSTCALCARYQPRNSALSRICSVKSKKPGATTSCPRQFVQSRIRSFCTDPKASSSLVSTPRRPDPWGCSFLVWGTPFHFGGLDLNSRGERMRWMLAPGSLSIPTLRTG